MQNAKVSEDLAYIYKLYLTGRLTQ